MLQVIVPNYPLFTYLPIILCIIIHYSIQNCRVYLFKHPNNPGGHLLKCYSTTVYLLYCSLANQSSTIYNGPCRKVAYVSNFLLEIIIGLDGTDDYVEVTFLAQNIE